MNRTDSIKLNYLASLERKDLRILGIDFGTKKLGAAIFHNAMNAVLPLCVLRGFINPMSAITQLVREYSCDAVVLGICNSGPNVKSVLKLQKTIQSNLEIPVFLQNESLTTYAANEILKEMQVRSKDRARVDDAIAADLILQSFICNLKL